MSESIHEKLNRLLRNNRFVCLNDSDITRLVEATEWQRLGYVQVSFDTIIAPCGAAFRWRRLGSEEDDTENVDRTITAKGIKALVTDEKTLSLMFGRNRQGPYMSALPEPEVTRIGEDVIAALATGTSSIVSIEFSYCDIEESAFLHLAEVPGLQALRFINTQIPSSWLVAVTEKKPELGIRSEVYNEAGVLQATNKTSGRSDVV